MKYAILKRDYNAGIFDLASPEFETQEERDEYKDKLPKGKYQMVSEWKGNYEKEYNFKVEEDK